MKRLNNQQNTCSLVKIPSIRNVFFSALLLSAMTTSQSCSLIQNFPNEKQHTEEEPFGFSHQTPQTATEIMKVMKTQIDTLTIESGVKDGLLRHAESYKVDGKNRETYVKGSDTYSADKMGRAIADGLQKFIDLGYIDVNNIEVIEIGPGIGDKLSHIIQILDSQKIKGYTLRDCSPYLLNLAKKELDRIIPEKGKAKIVDVYTQNSEEKEKILTDVNGKYIFIPNNSTLFTDPDWDYERLKQSKGAFITLDFYDDKVFSGHLGAAKLCLDPLKACGISYVSDILEGEQGKHYNLFSNSYDEKSHTSNIRFDLGKYLRLLQQTEYKISDEICAKYGDIHHLNILRSLKFRNEEQAKQYYEDLGFKVSINTVELETSTKTGYLSIFLQGK